MVEIQELHDQWYDEVMITIIFTVIVSVLLGVTSPITSLWANQNLFRAQNFVLDRALNFRLSALVSQISSNGSLSEINPIESLGRVTGPLDSFLNGLGRYADIKPWLPKSALESISGFEGTLDSIDNISVGQVLRMTKSGFVLVAGILVTILEITLRILRGILGLVR